ncbi:42275_t:CDS:2, partial [Gigaspora margarita]
MVKYQIEMKLSCIEPNENVIVDILVILENDDISEFFCFLEDMKNDYQNASLLYDFNYQLDPTVNIKSGPIIHVQVESVKWRKLGANE